MPDILIRNVSEEVVAALEMMARAKVQSRQDMLKQYIEILASPYVEPIREMMRQAEQQSKSTHNGTHQRGRARTRAECGRVGTSPGEK